MHQKLDLLEGLHFVGAGCWMRNLLYILPGLLHNWMSCLLLGMEDWIFETLHLKVGMLHRELRMLVLELRAWNLHRVQMLKSLQHCPHQLVLVGDELFILGVGLVVGVAALAIAVVPHVHHLRGF
jgi:hypothetical protein